MSKLHIKTGDTVVLLTGDAKDRKKPGKVLQVSPKEGKVIVEKANMVVKHVKPRRQGEAGGRVEAEGAIYDHELTDILDVLQEMLREAKGTNRRSR